MEVVELLLMAPVDCPGLAAVKEGGKDDSAVHLDLLALKPRGLFFVTTLD